MTTATLRYFQPYTVNRKIQKLLENPKFVEQLRSVLKSRANKANIFGAMYPKNPAWLPQGWLPEGKRTAEEVPRRVRLGRRSKMPNLRLGKRSGMPNLRLGKRSAMPSLRLGRRSAMPSLRLGKRSAMPSLRLGKKSAMPKLQPGNRSAAMPSLELAKQSVEHEMIPDYQME